MLMLLQRTGQFLRIAAVIMLMALGFFLSAHKNTLGSITSIPMRMCLILRQSTGQDSLLLIAAVIMGMSTFASFQAAGRNIRNYVTSIRIGVLRLFTYQSRMCICFDCQRTWDTNRGKHTKAQSQCKKFSLHLLSLLIPRQASLRLPLPYHHCWQSGQPGRK